MGVRVGCWPVFCGSCGAAWSTGWNPGDHDTCPGCRGSDVRHAKKAHEKGEPDSYFEAVKAAGPAKQGDCKPSRNPLREQLLAELDSTYTTVEEKAATLRRSGCILIRIARTLAPVPVKHFDPLKCGTCGEDCHEHPAIGGGRKFGGDGDSSW
jgi:hypothetical protein